MAVFGLFFREEVYNFFTVGKLISMLSIEIRIKIEFGSNIDNTNLKYLFSKLS